MKLNEIGEKKGGREMSRTRQRETRLGKKDGGLRKWVKDGGEKDIWEKYEAERQWRKGEIGKWGEKTGENQIWD